MVAIHRLRFALHLLEAAHKEYLVVTAQFRWNRQCSFEDMRVSMLWALKLSIHASF